MGTTVDDALAGLAMTNPGVVLLKEERAIVRHDHQQVRGQVKLVSGGASGHEPYPAGFVGPGMLTAAVVGDVSVAPPPLVIVRVVRRLTQGHPEGVLLVVCDNPGDRLSFAVAAERLVADGVQVRLVVVGGMAEAVLIFKLAGAMVEIGASFDELSSVCSRAVANLATVTVGPELCAGLEHHKSRSEIYSSEDNVGLGINGDSSVDQASVVTISKMVQAVEKQFTDLPVPPTEGCLVILLVNNTGQLAKLKELAFAMKVTEQFLSHGYRVKRLYCGSFATSSKTTGFSVTALKMFSAHTVDLLDAPTSAAAWPRMPCPACCEDGFASDQLVAPTEINLEESRCSEGDVQDVGTPGHRVAHVIMCATHAMCVCEEMLNILDGHWGDGDCGTTLRRGAEAVAEVVRTGSIDFESPSAVMSCLGDVCGRTMGGVSGALYCAMFAAAAQELSENGSWTVTSCAAALRAGTEAVARYGGVQVGCNTMLDSLSAASKALDQSARSSCADGIAAARRAAEAAELAAMRTGGPRGLLRPHPDPGAHAVGIGLRAVCEGLRQVGTRSLR